MTLTDALRAYAVGDRMVYPDAVHVVMGER